MAVGCPNRENQTCWMGFSDRKSGCFLRRISCVLLQAMVAATALPAGAATPLGVEGSADRFVLTDDTPPAVSTDGSIGGAVAIGDGVLLTFTTPLAAGDPNLFFDFAAESLTIFAQPGAGRVFNAFGFSFNGFRFTFEGDGFSGLANVQLLSNTASNFVDQVATLDGPDTLLIDLKAMGFSASEVDPDSGAVTFAPSAAPPPPAVIPLPPASAPLLAGLMGLGLMARRRG